MGRRLCITVCYHTVHAIFTWFDWPEHLNTFLNHQPACSLLWCKSECDLCEDLCVHVCVWVYRASERSAAWEQVVFQRQSLSQGIWRLLLLAPVPKSTWFVADDVENFWLSLSFPIDSNFQFSMWLYVQYHHRALAPVYSSSFSTMTYSFTTHNDVNS